LARDDENICVEIQHRVEQYSHRHVDRPMHELEGSHHWSWTHKQEANSNSQQHMYSNYCQNKLAQQLLWDNTYCYTCYDL